MTTSARRKPGVNWTILYYCLLTEKNHSSHLKIIYQSLYKEQNFREKSIIFKRIKSSTSSVYTLKYLHFVNIFNHFEHQSKWPEVCCIAYKKVNKNRNVKKE